MQVNFGFNDNSLLSVNDVTEVEDVGRDIKVITPHGIRYIEKHGFCPTNESGIYKPALMWYEKIEFGLREGKEDISCTHVDVNSKMYPR